MRTTRAMIITGAAALAVAISGSSASAAPSVDTTVTFEIQAGTLDITAPPAVDLGDTAEPGVIVSGQIGPVTVTDARAGADASWEATVISTDFTTGTSSPTETVAASLVEYWSGPATATTGDGTFEPGQEDAGDAVPIDTETTAFTHTGGSGVNSATWNPTLEINLPGTTQAGVYTGTVTHSVA